MTEHSKTDILNQKILKSSDIKSFLNENKDDISNSSFSQALYDFMTDRNLKSTQLFERSGINESYGYQLLNGKRQPSRDKVIQLALGLTLSVEQTNQLLRLAERSPLYVRAKRDAIIIFCQNNGHTLTETNMLLEEEGCDLLD